MQPGAAVVIRKGLEFHAEVAAITEQELMVLRDTRRAGIKVQLCIEIELTGLGRIDLVDNVTGAQRQHPAAGRSACFQKRAGIAEARHLVCCRHAGDAGAQDNDGFSGTDACRPVPGPW